MGLNNNNKNNIFMIGLSFIFFRAAPSATSRSACHILLPTPLVDDCTFWHHAFFNCTTPGSLIAREFHKTRSQTIPPRPNHHRLYLARKLRNTDSSRMAECHYSQICFPHFQICHVSMSNGVVQSVLVIVKTRNINLHHVNPSLFSLSRSRSDEAIEATSNLHYQTLIGYLQNSDKLITIQQ